MQIPRLTPTFDVGLAFSRKEWIARADSSNVQNTLEKQTLQEANPELAAQWHPSKNGSLTPGDVTPNAGKKVWWKCPKGVDHEWHAIIANRNRGSGCPICSNQRVAVSNSLGAVNPELAKEWHPSKNGALTPYDVLPSAARKVWWQCAVKPNHEWEAKLNNRANGKGCPYCANQRISGENSLGAVNPALAVQWHPTNNGDLSPFDVAPSAKTKVWWKCPNGDDHEWQATVNHRATGTGCPKCNPVWSVPELRIYTELGSIFPSIEHRAIVDGFEVDVYIPELKIGIEYDGVYWHDDKIEKDREKSKALESSIFLIRIREDDLPLIGPNDLQVDKRKLSVSTIKSLLTVILEHREPPDETVSRIHDYLRRKRWAANDGFERLYFERKVVKYKESLSQLFPDLAREWHPIQNDRLLPEQFTPGSGRNVWWLGRCGHEWQDTINHRSGGRDCPECRYKKASETRRKNREKRQIRLFD